MPTCVPLSVVYTLHQPMRPGIPPLGYIPRVRVLYRFLPRRGPAGRPRVGPARRPLSLPDTPDDIEFRSVTKRYGDVTAVSGIDLAVPKGAFVALLGPSGCGKTTCLRMIGGFEQPSEGTVLIGGRDR